MQNIRVQEKKRQYFNFGRPSLFPSVNFNAEKDASEILKCFEKKKSSILSIGGTASPGMVVAKILGRRTADQRCEIRKAYDSKSSTSLEETIKKKLTKDGVDIMLESIKSTDEYLASEINDALKDKVDKNAIFDVLIGLSNYEVEKLKAKYQEMFQKDLVTSVKAAIKDKMIQDFIVTFLAAKRPEPSRYEILLRDFASMVDLSKAAKDAAFLDNTGLQSQDYISALKLFCTRTKPELRACFEEMYNLDPNGFAGIVDKKVKDKETREDLKSIGFAMAYPEEYYTDRLFQSMKGIGTKDRILRRVCIMRSEVDMEDIKLVYRFIKNSELIKDVEGDTSGEFKVMLSCLIGV